MDVNIESGEGIESGIEGRRKRAVLRQLGRYALGQHYPSHCPSPSLAPAPPPNPSRLGQPIDIKQVAQLVGCSPWTVRQSLLRRGLPHFRLSGASSKLIFYTDQVVRWIERQQQGGQRK